MNTDNISAKVSEKVGEVIAEDQEVIKTAVAKYQEAGELERQQSEIGHAINVKIFRDRKNLEAHIDALDKELEEANADRKKVTEAAAKARADFLADTVYPEVRALADKVAKTLEKLTLKPKGARKGTMNLEALELDDSDISVDWNVPQKGAETREARLGGVTYKVTAMRAGSSRYSSDTLDLRGEFDYPKGVRKLEEAVEKVAADIEKLEATKVRVRQMLQHLRLKKEELREELSVHMASQDANISSYAELLDNNDRTELPAIPKRQKLLGLGS